MLIALLKLQNRSFGGYPALILLLTLISALALLTHNSALVFLPAAAIVLLLDKSRRLFHRTSACCVLTIGAVIPWLATRSLLGQSESHPLGHSNHILLGTVYESLNGLGEFFFSSSPAPAAEIVRVILGFSLLTFVGWSLCAGKATSSPSIRVPILMAAIPYLLLNLLFNLIFIDSALNWRFLWFIPLCVVPVMCLKAKTMSVVILLCPILVGMQAYRVIRCIPRGAVRQDLTDIRCSYFISTKTNEPPPPGFVAVRPPTFKWQSRWNGDQLASEQQGVRTNAPPNLSLTGERPNNKAR
jgi:hypothetical protein